MLLLIFNHVFRHLNNVLHGFGEVIELRVGLLGWFVRHGIYYIFYIL